MQKSIFFIMKTFTGHDELIFQGKQQGEIFPQLPVTPWTYLEPGARTQSRHRCVYGNTSRSQGSRRRPCTWGWGSGIGGEGRESRVSGTGRVSELNDETRQLRFLNNIHVHYLALYFKETRLYDVTGVGFR